MLGSILVSLKSLAILMSGIFGTIGILHDFKDKETKKITKWGKIGISGVFISTVIALLIQLIEFRLGLSDAEKAAKILEGTLTFQSNTTNKITYLQKIDQKIEEVTENSLVKINDTFNQQKNIIKKQTRVLTNTQNLMYPIYKDKLSFYIIIEHLMKQKYLQPYIERIKTEFIRFEAENRKSTKETRTIWEMEDKANKATFVWAYDEANHPSLYSITINPGSKLLPTQREFPNVTGDTIFRLSMAKKSIHPKDLVIYDKLDYSFLLYIGKLPKNIKPASTERDISSTYNLVAKFNGHGGPPIFKEIIHTNNYSIDHESAKLMSLTQLKDTIVSFNRSTWNLRHLGKLEAPAIKFIEISFRENNATPVRWPGSAFKVYYPEKYKPTYFAISEQVNIGNQLFSK